MSYKRKLLQRFESDEKRQRSEARDRFDERFDDDITSAILKYLPLIEKSKFEGVSKKWQRCVYKEEKCLFIGLSENALAITSPLVNNYPRVIPHLEKNYRLIRKLNINLAISEGYSLQFIHKFKKLRELGISGGMPMKILIDLFQRIPYRIQYYSFKKSI